MPGITNLSEDFYLTLCGTAPSDTCSQTVNIYLHGGDEENGDYDDEDKERRESQNADEWLARSKC